MTTVLRSGQTHQVGAYYQETRVETNGTRTVILQKDATTFWATIVDQNGNAGEPVNLFKFGDPVQPANGGITSFDFVVRADGRFVVAWTEVVQQTFTTGNGGTVTSQETQVVQRLYNSNGTPAGGKHIVASVADTIDMATGRLKAQTNELSVSITQRADGTLATTWLRTDFVEDAGNPGFSDPVLSDPGDIWFRISNVAGTPLGSAAKLNTQDSGSYGSEQPAKITGLDNGGFAAVWTSTFSPDPGNVASTTSLRLQTVAANGTFGTEKNVVVFVDATGAQLGEREASVHAIDSGFVVAVTAVKVHASDAALNSEVLRFYTYNNDGSLRGSYFEMARPAMSGSFSNGNYFGVDIEEIDGGGFLATWIAPVAAGAQSYRTAVYARAFDANGRPTGPATSVLDLPGTWTAPSGLKIPHEQFAADAELVPQSDGSFLVVANIGGAYDFAQTVLQRITLDGNLGPQAAPTAIALSQVVTTLSEAASTAARIKVANINLTDDGIGTNTFTLLGPDAARFEVFNGAVYLKAGTKLDYETKTSYAFSVAVNDATIASRNPDAVSQQITLAIRDVYAETIRGTENADTLRGIHTPDYIYGLGGNDKLFGNGGNDRLYGGAGNDTLDGGTGADRMEGGVGNDTYIVDNRSDVVVELANQGTDTVRSSVTHTLRANVENLVLLGNGAINGTGNGLANVITGNAAANVLNGANGNDTLNGGVGDDRLLGGAGDDRLLGGAGNDTLLGGADNDTLDGGADNDRLEGGAGNDTLIGGAGIDILIGGTDNDALNGGVGNDSLTGGAGRDTFIFNTALNATTNVDRITDFNVADDTIHLENAIFRKLAATGTLNADFFRVGAAALDANDYIVYNKDTGALIYDANGSAAGGAIQFATLQANLNLTSADFFVI